MSRNKNFSRAIMKLVIILGLLFPAIQALGGLPWYTQSFRVNFESSVVEIMQKDAPYTTFEIILGPIVDLVHGKVLKDTAIEIADFSKIKPTPEIPGGFLTSMHWLGLTYIKERPDLALLPLSIYMCHRAGPENKVMKKELIYSIVLGPELATENRDQEVTYALDNGIILSFDTTIYGKKAFAEPGHFLNAYCMVKAKYDEKQRKK